MRWEELFTDLEGQARALEREELVAEVAERTRGEFGQVSVVTRLRAHVGSPLELDVEGVGRVSGELVRVGPDCLLMDSETGGAAEILVVTAAVMSLRTLAPGAVSAE